jgi:hypothetical protein
MCLYMIYYFIMIFIMKNAKEMIDYIDDRIYCQCESNGNAKEAIEKNIDKFKDFLFNEKYDIENDLDEDKNNILHMIANSSLSEFYDIIKEHPKFDYIKNSKNKYNFTPYDIAKSYPFIVKYMCSRVSNNATLYVPVLVTAHYYFNSTFELIDKMKNDDLDSTFNYDDTNKYLSNYFKCELAKRQNMDEDTLKLLDLVIKSIDYLPNELFIYDNDIHKKIENIMKSSFIDISSKNYVEKQKISLQYYSDSDSDSDSDGDNDNIVQDYDE